MFSVQSEFVDGKTFDLLSLKDIWTESNFRTILVLACETLNRLKWSFLILYEEDFSLS